MGNLIDLTGKKYGKLTVIERAESSPNGKVRWICKCDCGRIKSKSVFSHDLISGKVKSCGCLYHESNKGRNKTHGFSHSRIYNIWFSVKQRCNYEGHCQYSNYGGRGIKVCEEWLHDFQAFYDWAMANGYRDDLTIDRIDNNKGYSPDNCRWVDMKTQQNNRTNNRTVIYCGVEFTIAKLAAKLNIPYATLLWRINNGWEQGDWGIKPNLSNRIIRSIKHELN